MKNPPSDNQGTDMSLPPAKKGRTSEDFLKFCKFILDYENYDAIRRDEKLRSRSRSPPNSSESGFESSKSDRPRSSTRRRALRPESPVQKRVVKRSTPSLSVQAKEIETSSSSTESDTEAEGYNDVTCYCGKPYAGRPMIECTNCLTWLHISCAKVKRTNIPEIFICSQCTGHESQSPDHTMPSNRSFSGSRNARNRAGDL